jgi:hypothetical protein
MSTPARDRMRAYRCRVANGIDIFRVEVPYVPLADVLVRGGG